jgi:hypothetical protein
MRSVPVETRVRDVAINNCPDAGAGVGTSTTSTMPVLRDWSSCFIQSQARRRERQRVNRIEYRVKDIWLREYGKGKLPVAMLITYPLSQPISRMRKELFLLAARIRSTASLKNLNYLVCPNTLSGSSAT